MLRGEAKGIGAVCAVILILILTSLSFAIECFPDAQTTYLKISSPEVVKGASGVPTVSIEASLFYMGTITLSPSQPALFSAENYLPKQSQQTAALAPYAQSPGENAFYGGGAAFLSGEKASLAGSERIGAVGIEGGLIIVSWGTYPDNVCKTVTNANGIAKATSLPYPADSKSMTYKATFCPYTRDNNDPTKPSSTWMANCAQLEGEDGNAITTLNWRNIRDCAGAENIEVYVGGQGEDCGEKFLPSSDFASISNTTPSNADAGFCWVLAFLFGLLASASYTMGRNPFQFLNPAIGRSVKMNRNAAYYRPMHQSVSIDPTAYWSALDRTASTIKGGKEVDAQQKVNAAEAELGGAETELATAKTPAAKAKAQAKITSAKQNVRVAKHDQSNRMRNASKSGLVSGIVGGWTRDLTGSASDGAIDALGLGNIDMLGLTDENVKSSKEKYDASEEKLEKAGEKLEQANKNYDKNSSKKTFNAYIEAKEEYNSAGLSFQASRDDLKTAVEEAEKKQGFWSKTGNSTLNSLAKSVVSQGIRGVLLTPMAILGGGRSVGSAFGYAAKKAGVGVLRDTFMELGNYALQQGASMAYAKYDSVMEQIGEELRESTVASLKEAGISDAENKVKMIEGDNGQILITYTDDAGKTRVVAGTTNNADNPYEVFQVGKGSGGEFGTGNIFTTNVFFEATSFDIKTEPVADYFKRTEPTDIGASGSSLSIGAGDNNKKVFSSINSFLINKLNLGDDNDEKLKEKIEEINEGAATGQHYIERFDILSNALTEVFNNVMQLYDPFKGLEPEQYSLRKGLGGDNIGLFGMSEGAWEALGTASLEYFLNSSATNNQFMLSIINNINNLGTIRQY